jgi:hypothetical protein
VGLYVPDDMTEVFVGSVPGPLSQMTEWPFEGVDHVNVTVPAETVSGVGEKRLFLTEMLAVWPPVPPPPPPPPYVGELLLLQPSNPEKAPMTRMTRFRIERLPRGIRNDDGPAVIPGPAAGGSSGSGQRT